MPRRCLLSHRCHTHTQNAGTLLLVGRHGSLHQMVRTRLIQVSGTKRLSPNISLAYTLDTVAQHPRNIRPCRVFWAPADHSFFGSLPIIARGNSYILLFTDLFRRRTGMFAVTSTEFIAGGTVNISVISTLGMPIPSPFRPRTPSLRLAGDSRLQTSRCTQTHDKRLLPEW